MGTVRRLKLSDGRGFVELDTSDGDVETFIIWYNDDSRGPAGLYTSELTTAMVHGLTVGVVHESSGAYIEDLKVLAPSP